MTEHEAQQLEQLQQENTQLRQQLAEQQETLSDVKEELKMITQDWNDIVRALGLRHHGTAIARAAEIRRRADACTCSSPLITTNNLTDKKG